LKAVEHVDSQDLSRRRKDASAWLLQTPFWNIIAISIGLVGTITTIQSWLNQENLRSLGWPTAAFLAVILTFMLGIGFLRRKANSEAIALRKRMANYLLIVPSNGEETFYLNWVFLLLKQAQSGGHNNVFITAELAPKSFSKAPENQRTENALEQLEEMKRFGQAHFDGAFVIVEDPNEKVTQRQLRRYYDVFNSNVVLLDMNINYEVNLDRGFPKIDFVGSDECHGGFLAASLACDYFDQLHEIKEGEVPKILILEPHIRDCDDLAWDHRRIIKFRSTVSAKYPGTKFTVIGECKYHQLKTKKLLEAIEPKDSSDLGDFLRKFDLIFASNDDSALGALEVIREYLVSDEQEHLLTTEEQRHPRFIHQGPRIIGYDGSPNFLKELKEEGNEWLLGTVDVKQEKQARIALDQMQKLRRVSRWSKAVTALSRSREVQKRKATGRDLELPQLVEPEMKIAPFLQDSLILNREDCSKPPYSVDFD